MDVAEGEIELTTPAALDGATGLVGSGALRLRELAVELPLILGKRIADLEI